MDIIERLQEVINYEGITVSAFARKIGVVDQTIRGIVVQKRNKQSLLQMMHSRKRDKNSTKRERLKKIVRNALRPQHKQPPVQMKSASRWKKRERSKKNARLVLRPQHKPPPVQMKSVSRWKKRERSKKNAELALRQLPKQLLLPRNKFISFNNYFMN